MKAGRKRKYPYEKLWEALDYCTQYCDGQETCEDCMLLGLTIHRSIDCPITEITSLKYLVEQKIEESKPRIDWDEVEL